ncbi:MAG: sensor histidine kinase, partial [Candidatus Hodarchaeota archaeon]
VTEIYADQPIAENKTIQIDPTDNTVEVITDRTLLRRVLGNMVKNALEATPENGTVKLGFTVIDEKIQFWVFNPGFIPRDVELQIFNRSFSTKSANRGLGTYSMKLLSSYLDGNVWFTTSKKDGTTFFAQYPRKLAS